MTVMKFRITNILGCANHVNWDKSIAYFKIRIKIG